ncbi:MAG: SprT-like domain-containing protein [Candidatus Sulfotelmatobacter sp.]
MKKVLAGVLAAVIIFSGNALRAQYTHDNGCLQQDYADYNRAFFNDTLPKNVPVTWSDIPRTKDGRYVMGNTHEDIVSGTFSIQIDTKSNIAWATANTTLLHEMCHVKTYDRTVELDQDMHGPLFKACIVNLELQGAFTDLL